MDPGPFIWFDMFKYICFNFKNEQVPTLSRHVLNHQLTTADKTYFPAPGPFKTGERHV